MIKRVILLLTVVLSLVWIAIYALDILDEKNNYNAEDLFGEQDEELLIILRPTETSINAIPGFDQSPVANLVSSMKDSLYDVAYISKKRAHFLLTREGVWSESIIRNLFTPGEQITFENETFKIGKHKGRYHKKNLYISKDNFEPNDKSFDFIFDSKASAAIIKFGINSTIASHSDIYVKNGGLINYVTKSDEIKLGNKVSDEDLFSGVISRNIDSYHFQERTYRGEMDTIFKNGPMYRWMQFGFVEINHRGKKALISDYIEGQDPILVLNEINGTNDTSWFTNPLLSDFPAKGQKYKVEYMEDFVVISTDGDLCKKMISEFKLGNTISLNENSRNRHYGSLPKNVSERMISDEQTYSRSAYKGKLLESYTNAIVKTKQNKTRETISISVAGDIADFYAFSGDGNVLSITNTGELKRFVDEKLNWETSIGSKPESKLQVIDLHANGEKQILVNTKDEIHLFNLKGEYVSGFPAKLENDVSCQVKFYRWKGQSYFMIGTENGQIIHLDAKGRELNIYKNAINSTEEIQVWASQNRLFAGFSNGATFIMYDLDKNRIHREFALPYNSIALKIPNEILHFGMENDKLVKTDQKGNQSSFGSFNQMKVLKIQEDNPPIIAIQSKNEIHLLNIEGVPFGEIRLPFNEVEDIFIENTDSGKTLVGFIDGLENNVYLYETDGQLVTKKGLEGQKKLTIQSTNKGYRISTIVDQFIVQYFEN